MRAFQVLGRLYAILFATALCMTWSPRTQAQHEDVEEEAETGISVCRAKVRGRRVTCSYAPNRHTIALGCKCGWGSYFEDMVAFPPELQGQSLRQLRSFCRDYAKRRCAPITRPIRVRCKGQSGSCSVAQPGFTGESGKVDLAIECNCRRSRDDRLFWSFENTEPNPSPLSRSQLREVCKQELDICQNSGLLHREHHSFDPHVDPYLRSFRMDCASSVGRCSMSRFISESLQQESFQTRALPSYPYFRESYWCRCFNGPTPKIVWPPLERIHSMARCYEALSECDPGQPYAHARLPRLPLSSSPDHSGCAVLYSCENWFGDNGETSCQDRSSSELD